MTREKRAGTANRPEVRNPVNHETLARAVNNKSERSAQSLNCAPAPISAHAVAEIV
jgi:hypothetical protein